MRTNSSNSSNSSNKQQRQQRFVVERMPKADEREKDNDDSTKYFIETCQEKISQTKRDTKGWIDVINVLQLTRDVDKSRIILTTQSEQVS